MRSPMFIPEPSLANTEDTAVVLKGYGNGAYLLPTLMRSPMFLPEASLANTEDTAVVLKGYGSGVLTVPRSLLVSQEYSTACHLLLVSASMSCCALVLNRYLGNGAYLLPTLMRSPMFLPEPSLANTEDTAVVLEGYGNGAYLFPTLMRSPMFLPELSLANTEDTAVVLKGYGSGVLTVPRSLLVSQEYSTACHLLLVSASMSCCALVLNRYLGNGAYLLRTLMSSPMLLPEPSLANTEDTAVVPKRYGSGVLTVPRSLLVSQEYSTACHRLLVSASMSYSALVLNRYLVPFGYLPASVRGFARGRTKGTPRNRSLRWKSVKGVFVCLECKWKFNSPKALTEHFKRCHLEIYELNIRCTHCGNCFNSPTDKKDHACVLPDTLSSVSQFRNFKLAELQQRNRAKKLLPCCPEMEVDGIFAEANEFAVLNPENLCCVEKGLKLRDGDIGGDVTPLIPPSEVEVNSNNS